MASVDTSVLIDRELLVSLTEHELIQRGNQMACAELRIQVLKDERAAVGTRIKTHEQERKRLSGVIDTRQEPRPVKCKWFPDWQARKWRLRRMDTHDEVEVMDMTAADRQLDLLDQPHLRTVPATNDNQSA